MQLTCRFNQSLPNQGLVLSISFSESTVTHLISSQPFTGIAQLEHNSIYTMVGAYIMLKETHTRVASLVSLSERGKATKR